MKAVRRVIRRQRPIKGQTRVRLTPYLLPAAADKIAQLAARFRVSVSFVEATLLQTALDIDGERYDVPQKARSQKR